MLPNLLEECTKLTVCSKCQKNLEEHYIGVKLMGFYQVPDGRSYCDKKQIHLYKQMTNLELIEYYEQSETSKI